MDSSAPPGRAELAAVLDAANRLDMIEVGRIEQAHRCGQPLTAEERAAWDYLAAHHRFLLAQAGHSYPDHLARQVRRHGGTIRRERHSFDRHGQPTVTRREQHYGHALAPRALRQGPRPRGGGRPRARTSRTASARAGPSDDPGEPEPGPRSGQQPLLFLAHPRWGLVNAAMARALRRLGA